MHKSTKFADTPPHQLTTKHPKDHTHTYTIKQSLVVKGILVKEYFKPSN